MARGCGIQFLANVDLLPPRFKQFAASGEFLTAVRVGFSLVTGAY